LANRQTAVYFPNYIRTRLRVGYRTSGPTTTGATTDLFWRQAPSPAGVRLRFSTPLTARRPRTPPDHLTAPAPSKYPSKYPRQRPAPPHGTGSTDDCRRYATVPAGNCICWPACWARMLGPSGEDTLIIRIQPVTQPQNVDHCDRGLGLWKYLRLPPIRHHGTGGKLPLLARMLGGPSGEDTLITHACRR
jgi:hypothetical protein